MMRKYLYVTSFVAIALIEIGPGAGPTAANWGDCGTPICEAPGGQYPPYAVPDGAGGAFIAWSDERGGDRDIYLQHVNSAGIAQWLPDGVVVCAAAEDQLIGGLISDGTGGVIVVWEDYRAKTATAGAANALAFDYVDIYAQRVDSSGDTLWTANGAAVCTEANNQTFPSIVSDGAGGAFVAWTDERSDEYGDIYAQRVNSLGFGATMAGGYPVCSIAGKEQGVPLLVSDGGSGAIVCWRDARSTTGYDLYAQHIDQSVFPTWAWPDGVPICTASGFQWFHQVVADGEGGAIIAWIDARTYSSELFAQRVDESGVVQWPADGVVIDSGKWYRYHPVAVSDGNGGAVVVWEHDDWSVPMNPDVRAQRIDSDGNTQWPGGGVALTTAPNEQTYLSAASDGAGGAVVAWQDGRSGILYDVFAQSVDSAGVNRWGPDGVAVCSVDDYGQTSPCVVNDGYGGAIIAWTDDRDEAAGDIYAQKYEIATGIRWGQHTPATHLAQNRPNPFNPVTTISYQLDGAGHVTLRIYDTAGRLVRTLVDDERSAGPHNVQWDGTGKDGRVVASGLYFCRLEAGDFVQTRKMLLLK